MYFPAKSRVPLAARVSRRFGEGRCGGSGGEEGGGGGVRAPRLAFVRESIWLNRNTSGDIYLKPAKFGSAPPVGFWANIADAAMRARGRAESRSRSQKQKQQDGGIGRELVLLRSCSPREL